MRNKLLLLLIAATLCGCTKYVNVPTWVCPAPKMPVKQALKAPALPDNAPVADVLRSLVWDYTYLNGYARELELLLGGYLQAPAGMVTK